MAEPGKIANVQSIYDNFGITIHSSKNLCPTFSQITANSTLGVSGATYEAKQLVLLRHIYKKPFYKLTISNLNAFLSAIKCVDENGYWNISINDVIYDGGNYPTSYLQYNGDNFIRGTQEQWTALYNVLNDTNYWTSLELVNNETDDRFTLNDYSPKLIKTVFTNLKNGYNQTISLNLPSSVVIDLNDEWITGTANPSPSEYYSFESRESKGVDNSGDYIYLKIKGYTTYTLFIRSNGENHYDYVMVSKPDASITYSTKYNDTNVYAHTRNSSNSGTSLSAYTEVTFSGLTKEEHTITIVYKKDGADSQGSDAGYVLIPKGANVSYVNEYLSPTIHTKNIVFGFYDAALAQEIDMNVTVTIYSNNGQTYTGSTRLMGGSVNSGVLNAFRTGCTISIQYTGATPTNISYKYTITDNSTSNTYYFNFAQYYNNLRSTDKNGCYIDNGVVKESNGTEYVATKIQFGSKFFAAEDARLELYFYE